MSSKQFLYGLCIFYMVNLLVCPSVLAQTEVCTFSDSEIEGVEVGQIGDRQIYTLFTAHLLNQSSEAMRIVDTQTSVESVVSLIGLIQKYQERITSEQFDAQRITRLAELGKIDWIGIEHSKADTTYVDDQIGNYLYDRDIFNMVYGSLIGSGWDVNKTDQLLFLLHPAEIIARAIHPEAFHGVEIYPLEDEDLKQQANDALSERNDSLALIYNDVTDFQYAAILIFMNGMVDEGLPISERGLEIILDTIELPGGPTQTYLNIRRLIRAYNNIISLSPRRDAAIVQSVLDLPGNGLLLFGTNHGQVSKKA